jgi:type VI secretion system protein ImpM
MSRFARPSLFGKLPSILDYVRVNHASESGMAYDQWLERCQQELARAGVSWPRNSFRFLFTPPASAALLGVVGPSRDRAGRRFPLTIYLELPRGMSSAAAQLPHGFRSFFEDAEVLLQEAQVLRSDELSGRVLEVSVPTLEQVDAQRSPRHAVLARSITEFAESSLQGSPVLGVRSLIERFVRGLDSATGGVERSAVLDCPVASDDDVALWLILAERRGVASRALWCFWSVESGAERCLLGQGQPAPAVPVWLEGTRAKTDRLWSLLPSASDRRETPSSPASGDAQKGSEPGESGEKLERLVSESLRSSVA